MHDTYRLMMDPVSVDVRKVSVALNLVSHQRVEPFHVLRLTS
jgi:hypothetical protein